MGIFLPSKDQASWGCQSLSPEIQHMIYTENFAQNFGADMVYKCACMDATILADYFCKF